MNFDIQKIAKLSMIEVSEEEAAMYTDLITDLIEQIDATLPQADGFVYPEDGIPVMQLREDTICPSTNREEILVSAPQVQAGCFVVPKIVE